MTDDSIKLLCMGDLHLGRHPARIPHHLDGPSKSPRHVWKQSVDRAIQSAVDVVVITGDVIDMEHRYFGAYGAFLEGVRLLEARNIPVVCVGGNHDATTLPRMVEDADSDNVHLLGQNGTWERFELHRDGEVVLQLDGWSFPAEHVAISPLDDYSLPQNHSCPAIGLLHGDLGGNDQRYAPVSREELSRTTHEGWLLGHIHAPGLRAERDPMILYPGSPQPLDPGETGTHGPWLITLKHQPPHNIEARQLGLATLRYENVHLDMGDALDVKDVPPLVDQALESLFDGGQARQSLELMLLRIVFEGRSSIHSSLIQERDRLTEDLQFQSHGVPVVPEQIDVQTRPMLDMEELAEGHSPVAYLAARIMELEQGDENAVQDLIGDCRDAMQEAQRATTYKSLRTERGLSPPGRDDAIDVLLKQSRLLLDTLLQQKEEQE